MGYRGIQSRVQVRCKRTADSMKLSVGLCERVNKLVIRQRVSYPSSLNLQDCSVRYAGWQLPAGGLKEAINVRLKQFLARHFDNHVFVGDV